MILKDIIQNYKLDYLLGIESKSEEYKDIIVQKASQEGLSRAIEKLLSENSSAQTFIDSKGIESVTQEELVSNFPEIKDFIEEAVVNLKIELVNRLVFDLKRKIQADSNIGESDKNYFMFLLERVTNTLSNGQHSEIDNESENDLKLFYKKAKELKFIL